MFVEAVILGLIIGNFRNGNFGNLREIKIRGGALIILSGIIQCIPVFVGRFSVFADKLIWFTPVSILLLIICLFINIDKNGVWLIFIGTLMNFIVIIINGMKMPVLFKSLIISGQEHLLMPIKMGDVINYMPFVDAKSITGYFGKIIPIPEMYPFAHTLSIGDIIITIGIIVFLSKSMKRRYYRKLNRMY